MGHGHNITEKQILMGYHFCEMRGDDIIKKEWNQKMPTLTQKVIHNPIPTPLLAKAVYGVKKKGEGSIWPHSSAPPPQNQLPMTLDKIETTIMNESVLYRFLGK